MGRIISIIVLVILSLSQPTAFAQNSSAFTYVDLDNSFDPLIIRQRSFNYDAQVPVLSAEQSQIIELEDGFLFFIYANDVGYEPHFLNKASGKLTMLSDTDGLLGAKSSKFYPPNAKIFPIGNSHAIISKGNDSTGRTRWHITDGTPQGTKLWSAPFEGIQLISYLSDSKFIVSDSFNTYSYDSDTGETILLTEIRNFRLTHQAGPFTVFLHKSPIEPGVYEGTFTNGTLEATRKIYADLSAGYYPENNQVNKVGNQPLFFQGLTEGVPHLSRLNSTKGLVDLFPISEIPNCGINGESTIVFSDSIIEDDLYLYVNIVVQETSSLAIQCVVRYTKLDGVFSTFNTRQLNDFRWEFVSAANGKAYVIENRVSSSGNKYENVFELDFDSQSHSKLLEEISLSFPRSIELIRGNHEALFIFERRECFESCPFNNFIKVDLDGFQKVELGTRIGFTDSRGDITNGLEGFILDKELYFFASLPYPGLYKTNSVSQNIDLVSLPLIDTETKREAITQIIPSLDGWFVITASTERFYYVDKRGRHQLITVPNRLLAKGFSYAQFGNKHYFYGSSLYIWDGLSDELERIYTNGQEGSSYGTTLFVNDGVAFIADRDTSEKLYKLNLESGLETEFNRQNIQRIFKCGSNIYGSDAAIGVGDFLNRTNLLKFKSIYDLTEGVKSVETGIDSGDFAWLNLDAISDEKLFVVDNQSISIFDCNTSEVVLKEFHSLGNEVTNLEWGFNYDKFSSTMLARNFFNQTQNVFSYAYNSLKEILIYSGPGQVNLTGTQYGTIAFPEVHNSLVGKVYQLISGALQPIFELNGDADADDYILPTSQILINDDGRFLVSTYDRRAKSGISTSGNEMFIYDSLLDNFHFLSFTEGGTNSILNAENKALFSVSGNHIAVVADTDNVSGEIVIFEITCLVENVCTTQKVNRPPAIADGVKLYFEKGDNIIFPMRANDIDNDILFYTLNGHPEWMSIDNKGLITGRVPANAFTEYEGIRVTVSDGEFERESGEITFSIDDSDLLQPSQPTVPNEPANPTLPPRNDTNGNSSGGSMFYLLFLLCGIVVYRHNLSY